MKKVFFALALILFAKFNAQGWKTDEQYIQKFAQYAVEEMEKYKIPASITLAQGLLETGGGQSRLAQQGNNHFGIKCKEDWTGKTMKHTDDAPNECFRVYDDPRESYEDHSKFLAYRKYYVNLFKLDMMDYKAWAHGLKKAGYATNPKYAYILIDKIEKNKLYEYDKTNSNEVNYALLRMYPALKNDGAFMANMDQGKGNIKPIVTSNEKPAFVQVPKKIQKTNTNVETINSILIKSHPNGSKKFVIIPNNIDLSAVSKKFQITESALMKWNELDGTQLKTNDILFLENKSAKGNVATYKSQSGESMHDIAQKFGIRLNKLYAKNRMDYGQQPTAGQLIYLQNKKPKKIIL